MLGILLMGLVAILLIRYLAVIPLVLWIQQLRNRHFACRSQTEETDPFGPRAYCGGCDRWIGEYQGQPCCKQCDCARNPQDLAIAQAARRARDIYYAAEATLKATMAKAKLEEEIEAARADCRHKHDLVMQSQDDWYCHLNPNPLCPRHGGKLNTVLLRLVA